MQRTGSRNAGLLQDDLLQVIRRAKIARVQFLRENSGSAIGWSALACGLALFVAAILNAAGSVHDVQADAAAHAVLPVHGHPLRGKATRGSQNRASQLQQGQRGLQPHEDPRTAAGQQVKQSQEERDMFRKGITGAALVAGLAAAGTSSAWAQDTIKVGMVMPMTGVLGAAGQQVVAGARFYMQQHGDTVAGRKIELIVKDDGTVPDVGRRLTQELIANDKIDLLAGGLTADLLASAALINETKKPTVIMLASTTTLIEKSPYFVRTSCTMAQSSAMMADWAIKNGMTKVVTLVSDFAPGVEAEGLFRTRYLAAGGQIAEAIRVPLQSPDFAPALQRARDAAPQGIFLFVPSVQAGTFARQFVERGMDKSGIKLIGPGDITDDDLLPKIGDAMLGTITAHFYSVAHPSAMNKAFVAAFERAQGS